MSRDSPPPVTHDAPPPPSLAADAEEREKVWWQEYRQYLDSIGVYSVFDPRNNEHGTDFSWDSWSTSSSTDDSSGALSTAGDATVVQVGQSLTADSSSSAATAWPNATEGGHVAFGWEKARTWTQGR